jgi:hypothetical protein
VDPAETSSHCGRAPNGLASTLLVFQLVIDWHFVSGPILTSPRIIQEITRTLYIDKRKCKIFNWGQQGALLR